MSKIDDLIAKYCPNGVEYKKLGEITFWDKRFNGSNSGIQPKIVSFKHIPAADLKNIPQTSAGTIRLLSTGNFSGTTSVELVEDKNIINSGEIISIPSGGAATIKYYKGDFIDSGNILAVSANIKLFNLKYIYHCLLNIQETLNSLFRGAGIKHPSMLEILQLQIPVPPLAVQEEIVNILDSFTLLEAELEAELEARKKQYEHYRDKLLNPDNMANEVKLIFLKDCILSLKTGLNPRQNFKLNDIDANNYYVTVRELTGMDVVFQDKTDKVTDEAIRLINNRSNLEINDILYSGTGTIGRTALVQSTPTNWNIKEGVYVIKPKTDIVLPKFLLFVLHSAYIADQVKEKSVGSPVVSIPMGELKTITIPVPTIEEQTKIVSILDKFYKLVNDISDGLPAEINARRQQYEYYRDKLLNFEPMAA